MDLWVRSQGKMELKCNPNLVIEDFGQNYCITDRYAWDRSIILGKYKSKERALEVLDEISNFIMNDCQEYITTNENEEEICCCYRNVYVMPEE